jgi:hypothetical protein
MFPGLFEGIFSLYIVYTTNYYFILFVYFQVRIILQSSVMLNVYSLYNEDSWSSIASYLAKFPSSGLVEAEQGVFLSRS